MTGMDKASAATPPDLTVSDHGSVMMVHVHTPEARAWIDEHVKPEAWQWMGNGFAVEPRYVVELLNGAAGDGLTVAFP